MGLDPEQRKKLYRWSDAMMAGDGHTDADDPVLHAAADAFGEYVELCLELIDERRGRPEPHDDLIAILTRRSTTRARLGPAATPAAETRRRDPADRRRR